MIPMVMVELKEDVVGTDGVWRSGQKRPVPLGTAASWIGGGVATAVLPKQKRHPLPFEAPEKAIVLPYVVPEHGPC